MNPAIGRRHGFTYPKALRLRTRRDYLRVQGSKYRHHSPYGMIVLCRRSVPSGGITGVVDESMSRKPWKRINAGAVSAFGLRLGVTVTKKVGHAPLRNAWKRRVREGFRAVAPEWSKSTGLDLVWIAKPGSTVPSVAEVESTIRAAVGRWYAKCGGAGNA